MNTQSSQQHSRLRAIVLNGDGAIHPDPQVANEVRYIRYTIRSMARRKQPTLQFNIPIYKPE